MPDDFYGWVSLVAVVVVALTGILALLGGSFTKMKEVALLQTNADISTVKAFQEQMNTHVQAIHDEVSRASRESMSASTDARSTADSMTILNTDLKMGFENLRSSYEKISRSHEEHSRILREHGAAIDQIRKQLNDGFGV